MAHGSFGEAEVLKCSEAKAALVLQEKRRGQFRRYEAAWRVRIDNSRDQSMRTSGRLLGRHVPALQHPPSQISKRGHSCVIDHHSSQKLNCPDVLAVGLQRWPVNRDAHTSCAFTGNTFLSLWTGVVDPTLESQDHRRSRMHGESPLSNCPLKLRSHTTR